MCVVIVVTRPKQILDVHIHFIYNKFNVKRQFLMDQLGNLFSKFRMYIFKESTYFYKIIVK